MMMTAKTRGIILAAILLILPLSALAQNSCTPGMPVSTTLCNGFGAGVTSPQAVVGIVFQYLGTVLALLAIIMVVYSGFRMALSAGSPENLKVAKAGFVWAIIGFIGSALSFVIVLAFQRLIGVQTGGPSSGPAIINPLSSATLDAFTGSTLSNSVAIIGVLASVMIVYNAYLYMTAGGNDQQLQKAKSGLLWSVVGFLTVILAFVIIRAVTALF